MTYFIPSKARQFLDPGLHAEVIAKVPDGTDVYYLLDQWGEESGGQILLREDASGEILVVAADTSILPLAEKKVPPAVLERLSPQTMAGGRRPEEEFVEPRDLSGLAQEQMRERLLEEAKLADGTLDTDVSGTNHGRLACAWAVNHIAKKAFGREIGGGLSTIQMHEVLEDKHFKVRQADAKPGCVIISPTEGSRVGHVGILGETPPGSDRDEAIIYSNRSSTHTFGHHYTLRKWKTYYGDHQGLPVDFFDLDARAFEVRIALGRKITSGETVLRVAGLRSIVDFYPGDARNPDFGRIARAGIVGVIHKATDPVYSFNAARYKARRQAARQAGLLWGSYHFGRAGDGIEQADHYLDMAEPEADEIVCLDFERDDNRPDTVMTLRQAVRFVGRIQDKLHKPPVLYAGHYLRELLGGQREHPLNACPIWFADYRTWRPAPEIPTPWRTWALWQYAGDVEEGESGGVPSLEQCDRNSFNGTLDELKSFWTSRVDISSLTRKRGEIPQEERARELDLYFDMHNDLDDPMARQFARAAEWRAAKSLIALRTQINQMAPNRNKSSDGTIGDESHCGSSGSTSDHCAWVMDGNTGVVTALDITHDPAHGCDCAKIIDAIWQSRDPRVKYMIWNSKIANSSPIHGHPAWTWRDYNGANPHNRHFHISVKPQKTGEAGYDTTSVWTIRQPLVVS